MHVTCHTGARSRNHCYRRKVLLLLLLLLLLYSECVSVALVIQHATRMRRIVLPSVACPALQCSSTLSHKLHDFRDVVEHKKCVSIFSTTFLSIISHAKKNSERYDHKYT
jgi:hypothetical protein